MSATPGRDEQTCLLASAGRKNAGALVLCRSGDPSEEPKPDPISNSAVKLLSADGTVSQDPGE